MEDNRNIMGERIKERRKFAKLSQKELGYKIGVTYATISKYESGEIKSIDAKILNDIAKCTNTNINYFLLNIDKPDICDENIHSNIQKKIEDNNIKMAANSDIDLAKYAKLDKDKKEFVSKQLNAMIDVFLKDDK